MAQASAIATLEQIAPGRLIVGFGTGFTGRAGIGKKPLTLASMRPHIVQVKALLRGGVAEIDGGLAQFLASDDWLPDRPIDVPIYMAGQGPKARALAKEITDGLISLGTPAEGFKTCLVSVNGTVLDDGEDVTSPRASTAVKPLIALAWRRSSDASTAGAVTAGGVELRAAMRAMRIEGRRPAPCCRGTRQRPRTEAFPSAEQSANPNSRCGQRKSVIRCLGKSAWASEAAAPGESGRTR